MASQFQQESLKIVVAQVCQTIGFQGINSTPLNVIIDLLHRYIKEIATTTHHYAEHGGRTTPNLDDLSLAFREMGISLSELEEYVSCVEPTPFPYDVPKVPVPRFSNLNFLKPGAREILSRPLYVHEHLPPMYPEKEEEEDVASINSRSNNLERESDNGIEEKSPSLQMKRSLSEGETSPTKKTKYTNEEEGEPVREIDSVMMTTSGFISSAREGKLPEAKRPNIPMVQQRSNSPISSKVPSSHNKKRSTMEKIIRHKNHQGGIMPGPLANPKSREFKFKPKPKIPSAPPGTGSLQYSRPGGIPPKLKIPVPKIPIPKIPAQSNIGENVNSSTSEISEKKKRKDKERRKERSKEGKKDKKEDRPRKDKNRDDKKKRDKSHHNKMRNERTRIRMKGLTKEEELKRYKERENELIAALAASSAVTVTSIPPPSLRVREISQEKSPEKVLTSPQDGKSKLSIFKKVNKSKDGDKYRSRENSPVLMIDDIVKEEPKSPPPSPSVDYGTFHEQPVRNSPPGTPSTPKTPDILPVVKNKRGRPHKIKIEDGINISPPKRYSKVNKNSSPRGRKRGGGIFSPSWRHPMGEMTPDRPNVNPMMLDRPKTPEGLLQEDLSSPSFSIPSFPSAPGFIPPFSRFPFGPFGSPPAIPTALPSTLSDRSRLFMSPTSEHKRTDIDDNRPPTPTHEGTLSIPLHVSNRSEQFLQDSLPPLPETPKLIIKEAHPRQTSKPEKLSKVDKEKKKEHKKEKKEKEKLRKKKEKKEKEKAREEKKKEKERLKLERKEKKKRGRKRSDQAIKDTSVPKITLKFPSEGSSSLAPIPTPEHKPTPKLVIKPVVKHPYEENKMLLSVESKKRLPSSSPPTSSMSRMSSIKLPPEDEPGSPPEVAKFSPLITRPPKVKSMKKNSSEPLTVPPLKIKDPSSLKISKQHELNSSKNLKESHKDLYKEHKESYKDHKDPYKETHKEYKELHKEYKEPHKEYKEPYKEYKEIHKDQRDAHKECKETHKDYKDPHKDLKESHKDFKEPHKDIKEHKDLSLSQLSATVPPLKIRNAPPLKIRNASPLKIRNAPPLKVYDESKPQSSKKGDKKDKKRKSPVLGSSPPLQDNTTIKITSILPPQQLPTPNVMPEQSPQALSPTPKGSRKSIIIVPSSSSVTPSTSQPSVVPPSSKTTSTGLVTETVGPIGHFVDDQGNEVWICPTCGKQDDGSPMIGCDTCDDWYHWLCVGIHVPPSERENWYCPRCLSQHKQKGLGNIERKKRGRKRKFPTPS